MRVRTLLQRRYGVPVQQMRVVIYLTRFTLMGHLVAETVGRPESTS